MCFRCSHHSSWKHRGSALHASVHGGRACARAWTRHRPGPALRPKEKKRRIQYSSQLTGPCHLTMGSGSLISDMGSSPVAMSSRPTAVGSCRTALVLNQHIFVAKGAFVILVKRHPDLAEPAAKTLWL